MSRLCTQEQVAEVAVEADAAVGPGDEPARRWALPQALRADAPAWIWVGMGVCAFGFVLIAVGWGKVAGETQVYLQLPYLVSAALVGLALVIVGLTVLNVATRHRDGLDRDRQIDRLIAVMDELRETLAERDRP